MPAARLAAVAALLALALSGCAGDAPPADAAAQAVEDLGVEATSTTGIIRGVVVDDTITPLAGIEVRLANVARNATTNELGAFGFDGLEPGTYFLTTFHPDYASVQQSADVVAGDQAPPLVRVQVTRIPRAAPYVETTQHSLFMDGSFAAGGASLTLGGFTGQGTFLFGTDVAANSTVAQVELYWDAVSPLSSSIQLDGAAVREDDAFLDERWNGPAPLVGRLNTTDGEQAADRVAWDITADRTPPYNVFVNQPVEAYLNVFYNLVPDADWQFGRDGPYPVPPA